MTAMTADEIVEAFEAAQATFEALGDGDVQVGVDQAYDLVGIDLDAVTEAAAEVVWTLPAAAAVSVAFYVGLLEGRAETARPGDASG